MSDDPKGIERRNEGGILYKKNEFLHDKHYLNVDEVKKLLVQLVYSKQLILSCQVKEDFPVIKPK